MSRDLGFDRIVAGCGEEALGKELGGVKNGGFRRFFEDSEGFELGLKRSSRLGWWSGRSREVSSFFLFSGTVILGLLAVWLLDSEDSVSGGGNSRGLARHRISRRETEGFVVL